MESILLIILIGLAGGIAVGLQSPMASILSQRLGLFESVFIVHIGGAVIALLRTLMQGATPLGGALGIQFIIGLSSLVIGAPGLAGMKTRELMEAGAE